MSEQKQQKPDYEPLCQVPKVTPPEEYRMGEHKPPMFLVVLFFLVFVWALISWIPFFWILMVINENK